MAVTTTVDKFADVTRQINALVKKQVLIGVPEKNDDREEGGPIGNAGIGYLMENGSPSQNVPARPHLVPGVESILPKAETLLAAGARGVLDGKSDAGIKAMTSAGILAENAVKALISSNISPALAPSTIRGRKYARGTSSRRTSEENYLADVKEGVAPKDAQAVSGIVALVNTGEYRRSITHVIRKR